VHLQRLELRQFRNFSEQILSFPQRLTLILGQNGQGKTSIIEAVYLLAHAKSFRSNRIRELVSWAAIDDKSQNTVECLVDGKLQSESGEKTLRCSIAKGKRSISLNGNRLETASSFYGQLNCVVFTPDDLILVKGGPSGRRSFLDRILAMSDRGYVDSLVTYQRALKNRNKVISESNDLARQEKVIAPWNTILLEHGLVISEKRKILIEELGELAGEFHTALVEESDEKVNFAYQSHFLNDDAELYSKETMKARFSEALAKDLQARGTSVGTHRDELLIEIDTGAGFRAARLGASQGQARCIALSLKLAAIKVLLKRTGELPILLLDDVESELDASRRASFYALLNNFNTQIIMTATELSSELEEACPELHLVQISQGTVVSD